MILAPSPDLSPVRADEVARRLRRAVRELAGDRRDEVLDIGGGQLNVPAELLGTFDSDAFERAITDAEIGDEDVVTSASRSDLDTLAEADVDDALGADPELAHERANRRGRSANRRRVARKRAAREIADAEAVARTHRKAEEEFARSLGRAREDVAAHVDDLSARVEDPAEHTAPESALEPVPDTFDPSDRGEFPNIDALVNFAEKRKYDLGSARTRPEIEAAVAAAVAADTAPEPTTSTEEHPS